jgi:eukaryotic-like serine/threonine-protein kinase
MSPNLWASVKATYLEACEAEDGYETFLESRSGLGDEVLQLVRQFLADSQPGPSLDRPCWICGREEARHTLEIGQILLGRFEIVGFIGAGGAGEVYRAFDHDQKIFLALKTLRSVLEGDSGAIAALRNELNVARQVTSPFVCRLYEAYWPRNSDAPPFLTMELLDGETLAHYLRRQTIPLATAVRLVLQMITGLEAAQEKGIVHRDFKPANIMIVDEGSRAVIMDFGLAREIAPGASLEATLLSKNFAGTPAYMSPEQLRGHRATFASDVHALGAVIFEMLTGWMPFEGDSPLDIAARRLNEAAPSPRRYSAAIDRRWEYAILRCLEADPKRRPTSAAAVRQLLQQEPPFTFRRRGIIAAGVCVVPAIVGGERFWTFLQRNRGAVVDVYDIANLSGDRNLDFVCRGTTSELVRRFGQSGRVSAIPMRTTQRAAVGGADDRLAIGGSLFRRDGVARLVIQISDGRSIVWSKSYAESRFGDLMGLQAEISSDAMPELVRRSPLFRARLFSQRLAGGGDSRAPTSNSAAFSLYIRGASLQQEYAEESLRAAVGYFERAIEQDPHFALALAALADCYLALLNFGFDFDGEKAAKARDAAQSAVREDPALPEAHAVLGAVSQVDWDWANSELEYDRALQLNPDFARAIRWRAGLVLQFARFDEAIAGMEKAFKIDPYDRGAVSGYGVTLLFARRFQAAAEMLQREIGDRDIPAARYNLGLARIMIAKEAKSSATDPYAMSLEQARIIESIERRSNAASSEMSDRLYALSYSMMSHYDLAAPYLERLERNVDLRLTSPGANATVYVAQNRLDEALTALERATLLRDRFVINLRVNVLLEALHGLPRFEALLQTLRLK